MTTEKSAKKKTAKKTTTKKAASKKAPTKKKAPAKKTGGKQAPGRSLTAGQKKAMERAQNYAASNLAAQVTETLLDEIRGLDKPWHKTPEAEQKVAIARLSDRVHKAMTHAVQILSARGHQAVICNLFSVTFKDGVRAIVTIPPGSDMRHSLADYATKDAVLVLADPSEYFKGLEAIKADADQPQLL